MARASRRSMRLPTSSPVNGCKAFYDNRIEMIPEQKINSMRGFLQEIDTELSREDN